MATAKPGIARARRVLETAILASILGGFIIGLLARLAMTGLTLVGGVTSYLNNYNQTNTGIAGDIWRQWRNFILPASRVMVAILYVWSDSVAFGR